MPWPITNWEEFFQTIAEKATADNHTLLVSKKNSWMRVRNAYGSILPSGIIDHLTDSQVRWIIRNAKRLQAASARQNAREAEIFWNQHRTLEAKRISRQRRDHLVSDL